MIAEALLDYVLDWRFLVQLLVFGGVAFGLRVAHLLVRRRRRFKLMREHYKVDGPTPSLLDGSFFEFHGNEDKLNQPIEWAKQYGDYYCVFFGDDPTVFTTDLDTLKKIYLDEFSAFADRSYLYIDVPLTHGILFARHKRWKVMRRMLTPSFSKFHMRNDKSAAFIETTMRCMIGYIEAKLDSAPPDERDHKRRVRIDIHSLMKSTALHLISSMAIRLPDVRVQEQEPHVLGLDEYLLQCEKGVVIWAMLFPFMYSFASFLAKNLEHSGILKLIYKGITSTLDEGVRKLERERPARPPASKQRPVDRNRFDVTVEPDEQIIDSMIKLHADGRLSRIEVFGNCESVLYAGYDTTSTTLAYAFWVLARHAHIQEKLRAELIAHGTDSEYLEQVINETMRMYPVTPTFTSRVATRSVRINGRVIPEGTKVVFNTWMVHRDPKIWPQPEVFDPQRFARDRLAQIHPCAFAPFGMGERKCLGYKLAMLEMKMVLCDILLRFKIGLVEPQELKVMAWAFTLSKPKHKVVLEFERLH